MAAARQALGLVPVSSGGVAALEAVPTEYQLGLQRLKLFQPNISCGVGSRSSFSFEPLVLPFQFYLATGPRLSGVLGLLLGSPKDVS